MAKTYRRVILKPPEVSDDQWSRLGRLLAAAVDYQRRLAANSPHVLGLMGEVRLAEGGGAYYVEHEPANPIGIKPLFDPEGPKTAERQLLGMSVALFDALRVVHAGEGGALKSHGGLCPGVILVDPDGVEKVTDFGFAPALCEALGVERYVELAVGPREADAPEVHITGAWEVLAPEEFERHDRICAFIDPEKYGRRNLSTFESGSDIIAAGFILHLMAEHRHPYLAGEPDAHRLAGMSEYMAMTRYTGTRRQDMRESENPAVKAWCELVEKMLARTPRERPSAAEAFEAMREHVKLVDPAEIARRRLEACEKAVQQGKWEEVCRIARSVADSEAAPAEVAQRAEELLRQSEAHVLLQEALGLLDGDEWPRARRLLDRVRAMPGLADDLAQKAGETAKVVQQNVAIKQKLDAARRRLDKDTGEDPSATLATVKQLTGRINDLPPDDEMLPALRAQAKSIRQELSERGERAQEQAERLERERQQAVEADRAKAQEWLGQLEPAFEKQEWDELTELFAARPELQYWPEDVERRAGEIKAEFDEYAAERERMSAIKADVEAAQGWLQQLGQAVEGESWEQAERILLEKPNLAHVPEGLIQEIDVLGRRVQALVTHFVEDILSEQVAAFAPANRFEISVEVGEWKTRDDVPSCQTALKIACPTLSPTPAAIEVRVDRREDDVVIAEPDRVKRLIGAGLASLVRAAQEAALQRVCEPLRSGLFPAAVAETRLTEPSAKVVATIRCLDQEGEGGRVKVALTWDARRLVWHEQEADQLRDACLDLALFEIDAALRRDVIEASSVLAAHAEELRFEMDPPTVEGEFPTRVRRGGALEFTRAKDRRVFALERFEAAFPQERVSGLYEKLKKAEETLKQALAEGAAEEARARAAPTEVEEPPKKARRVPKLILPVAGVAVIAAAIGVWALWFRGEPAPAPSPGPPIRTPSEVPLTGTNSGAPEEAVVEQPTTPEANTGTPTVAATPDEHPTQPPPDEATSEDAQAEAALAAAVAGLEQRFTAFSEQLEKPTHAQLVSLIDEGGLDGLANDLLAIQDEVPPEQTDRQNQVAEWLQQTLTWKRNLDDYGRVLRIGGRNLTEAVQTAAAAWAIWPTAYVVELIDKLNRVNEPYKQFSRYLEERNWRAANFFLTLATRQAEEDDLYGDLRRTFSDASSQLSDARQDTLEPALQAAREWLQRQGDPSELPTDQLNPARNQAGARARAILDNIDYPPSVRSVAADEQEVIDGLLKWSTYTLALPGGGDLILTYIPDDRINAIDAVWMSQYEITVGQYQAVVGELPLPDGADQPDEEMAGSERNPVGFVTPDQARQFCAALSERSEGQLIFRLPFDDEWHHALLTGRGRVPTANPGACKYDATTGEPDLDPTTANFESDEGAFFPPGHKDGFGRFAPVGSYAPNRWGLYDMLGNVREWVIRRSDYKPITKGGSFRESVVGISMQRDPRLDFEVALDTRTPYEDNGFRIVVLAP